MELLGQVGSLDKGGNLCGCIQSVPVLVCQVGHLGVVCIVMLRPCCKYKQNGGHLDSNNQPAGLC